MKLPDFSRFPPLDSLRLAMGAGPGRFALAKSPVRLTLAEIDQLAAGGIEVSLDQVRILNDGTLAYKDSRIVLCVRNLVRHGDDLQPSELPAFHLADCKLLQELRAGKPELRYLASTREDALFDLRVTARDGGEPRSRREVLGVCLACLGRLCWQEYYQNLSAKEGRAVAAKFSLGQFFGAYSKALPGHNRVVWQDRGEARRAEP